MNLEPQEKSHFVAWLEQQLNDSRLLLTQVDKLGPETKPIRAMYESEIQAFYIVRKRLVETETMTLGPG